jgi:hypothetical protein
MSKTTLWIIIGILAAICLGQSRRIYAQNQSTRTVTQDPWEEQEQWMAQVRKRLFRPDPIPFQAVRRSVQRQILRVQIRPVRADRAIPQADALHAGAG